MINKHLNMKPANDKQTQSRPESTTTPPAASKRPRTKQKRDTAGKIVGHTPAELGSIDRPYAEQSRGDSELRYHAILLTNLNDAVIASDEQYRITAWNPAAELIYGWKAEEVLGRFGLDITQTEYPGVDKEAMLRSIAELGQWRGEVTQVRKDGSRFPVEISSIVLRDENGRIIGYLSLNRDITERKRAEETLRHRLAELEALHTVSAALRAAQTRGEALPVLLDEMLSTLETEAGVIWLYHPEHDELHAAVARGWFQQLSKTPLKPGEGIAGTVFASGQSYVSTEFRTDPTIAPATTRAQIPAGWGGACVAIRSGAITVGVLFVSVPLPRQIAPEQVKLLESLAEMAGASLHRTSLYEATVRQLDQLQSLHDIDLAITASMDLRVTLDVMLSHVLTQLKVDAANVLLLNPHLQTLEYAAGRGFRTDALKNTRLRLGEGYAGRAALERKLVHIPDLRGRKTDFLRSPFFSAEGFVAYYGMPLIAKGQVKGVLEIFHRAPLAAGPDWVNLLETLTGQTAIAIDNSQLFDNLQRSNLELSLAYDATIKGWSRAMDLRDKETEGHTLRVTELTERLARAMDVSEAEIVHIRRGALLHDIGKMGVPDGILLKPDKLTDDEWVLMRKHPQFGFDMLAPITYLKPALDIPYYHHEKWDGSGYPRGLKGEQIPLAARLFAVVDVWDALRSDRPYREAWPEEKAQEYIHAESGKHFDPQVVKVFERIIGEG
jgi:PAS domain S-box-containing protein/putative nucleotidyltransferase with HDIG domain